MNNPPRADIWIFQQALTHRLSAWGVFSVLSGLLLLFLLRTPFWNGLAFQFIGWGLIDLVIALVGGVATRRRQTRLADPLQPQVQGREGKSLERILWINTGLDVVYLLAGALLPFFAGSANPFWPGTGFGIIVQGGFLFCFDLVHVLRLREFRNLPNEENI